MAPVPRIAGLGACREMLRALLGGLARARGCQNAIRRNHQLANEKRMTPKRKFTSRGYIHIFQITVDGGICFYTAADCLVWFTLFCVLAKKYDVYVIAVCIMLNHFHVEAHFPSMEAMSAMMQELDARFTRQYNQKYGLKGRLFKGRYGSAPKYKEQKVRDTVVYVYNNPVPKKAVARAELYRWNFLAYMDSPHPFSDKVVIRRSSRNLLSVLAAVRQNKRHGAPLGYAFFSGMYASLELDERLQVLDYIVSCYNVIRYDALRVMWGGYQSMCSVLKTVGGAEHDVEEDSSQEDYRHYYQMTKLMLQEGIDLASSRFDGMCREELDRLAWMLMRKVGASQVELRKFLHMPFL